MEKYYKTFKESGSELSDLASVSISESELPGIVSLSRGTSVPGDEICSIDFDSRISILNHMIQELSLRMENVENYVDCLEQSGAILRFPFTRHLVSGCYGSDGKFSYVVKTVTYNSIEDVLGFDKDMCFSNPEDAALAANKLNSEK